MQLGKAWHFNSNVIGVQPTASNLTLRRATPPNLKKVGSIPSLQCTINNPISIIENPKLVTNNVSCHSWHQVGKKMCIKQKSSFVHKNLVDAIEKGNVALVESINWIMQIEKQQVQAKKKCYNNN